MDLQNCAHPSARIRAQLLSLVLMPSASVQHLKAEATAASILRARVRELQSHRASLQAPFSSRGSIPSKGHTGKGPLESHVLG